MKISQRALEDDEKIVLQYCVNFFRLLMYPNNPLENWYINKKELAMAIF